MKDWCRLWFHRWKIGAIFVLAIAFGLYACGIIGAIPLYFLGMGLEQKWNAKYLVIIAAATYGTALIPRLIATLINHLNINIEDFE